MKMIAVRFNAPPSPSWICSIPIATSQGAATSAAV